MTNNTNCILFLATHESCPLPAPLRHFAIVLAQLADWKTGRGIAGQGRLARAMGCGLRTVREHKAKLNAVTDSPVTVTWKHRSRPDGLNGSDSYMILPSDTGRILLDTGSFLQGHRQTSPNNITTGSPQVTPQIKEENESKEAEGLGDPASELAGKLKQQLPASALRVNGFHIAAASRVGEPVEELRAEWEKLQQAKRALFQSQQHLQASFGGWLKRRQKEEKEKEAEDDGWVLID